MENIYLDDDLKKLYMLDFESLLNFKCDFWELSPKILASLKNINKSSNVQSLYSSYYESDCFGKVSYLEFAYSKNIELQLLRFIIPYIVKKFNYYDDYTKCYFDFLEPQDNPNFKEGEPVMGIGSTDNINYFMINRIRITLNSDIDLVHDKFWRILEEELSKL